MPANFGVDISMNISGSFPDLDPTGKLVVGNQLLQQALINRLFCDKGSYLQSPDFGINLAAYENAALSKDFSTSGLASIIEHELQKDVRVPTVDAKVTFSQASMTLNIVIQVTPVNSGDFTLTISQVSQGSNFQVYFNQSAA
jgi:hypothetical protein